MNKPKPEYYCYQQCMQFLKRKYPDLKTENFLRWILDHSNDRIGYFERESLNHSGLDCEGDNRRIYELFLDEFENENGEVAVYIWW